MLSWRNVFSTMDFGKYLDVKTLLEANNIKFKSKVVDNTAVWLGTGSTRSINVKQDLNVTYELWVNKKDAEQTLYLIRCNSC